MENQKLIALFILIGGLTMLFLALMIIAFFSIYNKKMAIKESKIREVEHEKQLAEFKSVIDAEERQKEKIARDLHDSVVATLSNISRNIDKKIKHCDIKIYEKEEILKDVELLDNAIDDVRRVSHNLIPVTFMRLGLIKALEHTMQQLEETEFSFADFEDLTNFSDFPFNHSEQLSIYRIFTEVLNNLHKHANYGYLKVIIKNSDKTFFIELEHNGEPFTNEQAISHENKGLGLSSINSRLILLNGSIHYSIESDWSYIHINIPYNG